MDLKNQFITGVVAVIIFSFTLSAGLQINLLKNGSVNSGKNNYTPGWIFSSWNVKKGSPVEAALKWGIGQDAENNKCLSLSINKVVQSQIWFQQQVECEPGQPYTLSFRIRGSFEQQKWGNAGCGIYLIGDEKQWLKFIPVKNVKLSSSWQRYTMTFTTTDESFVLGVRVGYSALGMFKVYFDDISVVEGTEAFVPQIKETKMNSKPEVITQNPQIISHDTATNFGAKISRTMKELATSTPEKRNKVRLLFYGQSIMGLPWTSSLAKQIQKKYPNSDFTFKNLSIGGFTSERLVKAARQDLYPYYADFVIFHDYDDFADNNGQWEEMISTLRKKTTAEILIFTHHVSHQGNAWVQVKYDEQSQMIREIAKKYDCELVDVRPAWKKYLKENNLKPNDLLRDIVHLNKKGCKLMEELIWKHLRYNPKFKTPHDKWIKRIAVKPKKDGSIKVQFSGNRVDIVADNPLGDMGTAKILIDNKPPSANPLAYTFSRVSKTVNGLWWPAIYTISSNAPMPQVENWKLTITEVLKAGGLKYKVVGSKTGFDGNGNSKEKFISKSGRIVIDPDDFGIAQAEKMGKKKCPVGFEVKWKVVPMFKDIYVPPQKINSGIDTTTTVVKLIENTTHTLEIIPEGGAVPIKEIIVYQPAFK